MDSGSLFLDSGSVSLDSASLFLDSGSPFKCSAHFKLELAKVRIGHRERFATSNETQAMPAIGHTMEWRTPSSAGSAVTRC